MPQRTQESYTAAGRAKSTYIPLGFQEFAVQDGGTGSATDGVVREDGKSPVEYIAGTESTHHC